MLCKYVKLIYKEVRHVPTQNRTTFGSKVQGSAACLMSIDIATTILTILSLC